MPEEYIRVSKYLRDWFCNSCRHVGSPYAFNGKRKIFRDRKLIDLPANPLCPKCKSKDVERITRERSFQLYKEGIRMQVFANIKEPFCSCCKASTVTIQYLDCKFRHLICNYCLKYYFPNCPTCQKKQESRDIALSLAGDKVKQREAQKSKLVQDIRKTPYSAKKKVAEKMEQDRKREPKKKSTKKKAKKKKAQKTLFS
jgi:hypothetical protein